MDYQTPQELLDLGMSPMPDAGPKSVLEMYKNMSPPVQEYKIRRGDTLSDIAMRFGTTVRELARLNPNIRNVDKIKAGEQIDVPGKEKVSPAPRIQDLLQSATGPGTQNDALESFNPESLLMGGPGMATGAGVLGAMMPKAIQGLAGMAPKAMGAMGKPMLPAGMPNVMMPGGLNRGMQSAGNAGLSKNIGQQMMAQRGPQAGPTMPGMGTPAGGMPSGPMSPAMPSPNMAGGGMPQGGGNMAMLEQMLKAAGVR